MHFRSQWEMEKHNLESTVKAYLNKLNAETNRALTAEVKGKWEWKREDRFFLV